jgi:polyribonucleotide nucleotidyltransferase
VKLPGGVPIGILNEALDLARQGRRSILEKMSHTLPQARPAVKPHALKAEYVQYDVDRKYLVVGPRGEMRKFMEDLYEVEIDMDREGVAYIHGKNGQKVAACAKLVQDIGVIVKEGDTVSATVTSVLDYGVVVTINRAQQAILHQVELTHDPALLQKHSMGGLLKAGQRLDVKVSFLPAMGSICRVVIQTPCALFRFK